MKYLVSGCSAALVEYVVFLVLNYLSAIVLISNSVSFISGLTISFILNKIWVFSNKEKSKFQLIAYLALALINLMISNVLIWLLVEDLNIPSIISKLLAMGIIAIWNYGFFSKFIFNCKKQN